MLNKKIIELVLSAGAQNAAIVEVSKIVFEPEYRKLCESNACGNYGKSWMCPPYCGKVEDLIERAKGFKYALVYQTIGELEDSYDFEGMMEAGARHNKLAQSVARQLFEFDDKGVHLGAGGCRVCEECAKRSEQPCRFPDKAMCSLEGFGIAVSELAALAGMNYINGQNTVTYFGAYLFG